MATNRGNIGKNEQLSPYGNDMTVSDALLIGGVTLAILGPVILRLLSLWWKELGSGMPARPGRRW